MDDSDYSEGFYKASEVQHHQDGVAEILGLVVVTELDYVGVLLFGSVILCF